MHHLTALDRLVGQLRSNTQQLVNDFSRCDPAAPAQSLKKILMAFELRWKLEELVLMPALKDTQGVMLCGTRDAQRELQALRGLASLARQPDSSADRQRVLLSAIDALASLRTQRVSRRFCGCAAMVTSVGRPPPAGWIVSVTSVPGRT